MTVRALNLYYARDDAVRAEVLATRLRATDVRQQIGVPRGRVFTLDERRGDLPDVMWDCAFVDARAHDRDMQARAASADFEACRAKMRTLTRRFERVLYAQFAELGAPEIANGERTLQIWRNGEALDIESLRAIRATTVWRRMDDNARLPAWIIDVQAQDAARAGALDAWIAEHARSQAAIVRLQRVA